VSEFFLSLASIASAICPCSSTTFSSTAVGRGAPFEGFSQEEDLLAMLRGEVAHDHLAARADLDQLFLEKAPNACRTGVRELPRVFARSLSASTLPVGKSPRMMPSPEIVIARSLQAPAA
jgi:hypothetical protein